MKMTLKDFILYRNTPCLYCQKIPKLGLLSRSKNRTLTSFGATSCTLDEKYYIKFTVSLSYKGEEGFIIIDPLSHDYKIINSSFDCDGVKFIKSCHYYSIITTECLSFNKKLEPFSITDENYSIPPYSIHNDYERKTSEIFNVKAIYQEELLLRLDNTIDLNRSSFNILKEIELYIIYQ